MSQARESTDLFSRPVTALPGVAGRRAALLRRLDITTWFDLLTWFPRDFEDWSTLTPLAELIDGEEQTFVARVTRKPTLTRRVVPVFFAPTCVMRRRLRRSGLTRPGWSIGSKSINGIFFMVESRAAVHAFSVQNPAFEAWDPEKDGSYGIRPIYPLTEGLTLSVMRRLIQTVIPRLIGQIPEPCPTRFDVDTNCVR